MELTVKWRENRVIRASDDANTAGTMAKSNNPEGRNNEIELPVVREAAAVVKANVTVPPDNSATVWESDNTKEGLATWQPISPGVTPAHTIMSTLVATETPVLLLPVIALHNQAQQCDGDGSAGSKRSARRRHDDAGGA
jgi:hypothetical protein